MKIRTSFTEWCKLAGPGGPMLWVIDGIIESLSCALERHSNIERAQRDENYENEEDLGFILVLFLTIVVTVLIFILLASPY